MHIPGKSIHRTPHELERGRREWQESARRNTLAEAGKVHSRAAGLIMVKTQRRPNIEALRSIPVTAKELKDKIKMMANPSVIELRKQASVSLKCSSLVLALHAQIRMDIRDLAQRIEPVIRKIGIKRTKADIKLANTKVSLSPNAKAIWVKLRNVFKKELDYISEELRARNIREIDALRGKFLVWPIYDNIPKYMDTIRKKVRVSNNATEKLAELGRLEVYQKMVKKLESAQSQKLFPEEIAEAYLEMIPQFEKERKRRSEDEQHFASFNAAEQQWLESTKPRPNQVKQVRPLVKAPVAPPKAKVAPPKVKVKNKQPQPTGLTKKQLQAIKKLEAKAKKKEVAKRRATAEIEKFRKNTSNFRVWKKADGSRKTVEELTINEKIRLATMADYKKITVPKVLQPFIKREK